MEEKQHLFPLATYFPKRKGGMGESVPRQVDKNYGVPEDIEVGNSQGGRKDKHLFFFPFSAFHSLSHIQHFFFFL